MPGRWCLPRRPGSSASVADERIEFVHPLFASAVYSSAPLDRRRATHLALADAVGDPGGARPSPGPRLRAARRAGRAGGRGGSPRRAPAGSPGQRGRADRAGDPAVARGKPGRGSSCGWTSPSTSTWRATSRARPTCSNGSGGSSSPATSRARALLVLAEIDYWRKGESAATALVGGRRCATPASRLVQARCQVAIAMYAGTVDLAEGGRRRTRRPRAARRAAGSPSPGLVAAALSARVRADLFLGEGFDAEAAERALELERGAPPAAADQRVVFKLGQWLRYVDDLDGARARLVQSEQAARDEGDESSLANILLNRMIVETWAGRVGRSRGSWRRAWPTRSRSRGWAWSPRAGAPGGPTSTRTSAASTPSGPPSSGRDPEEPIVAMIWNRCVGLAALAAGAGGRCRPAPCAGACRARPRRLP